MEPTSNVIGFGRTQEEREVNWSVLRDLKEDLRVNKGTLDKEEDRDLASERLEEAKRMYALFLEDYVKTDVEEEVKKAA